MQERTLRRIAKAYNLEIMQIDRLKDVFDKYDADGSGQIDHSEFREVLCCLLGAAPDDISQQMLDRYWVEADVNGDGDISFEEFVAPCLFVVGEPGKL
ncbi:CABP5 [Symbiodinium natans]|uniref:CABP5 protein n=1 Tax=Symbiodinium natans TaxID=878477 RepID=A0A812M714_9DINO|nr:CABP5 [Symbiodinium natans]